MQICKLCNPRINAGVRGSSPAYLAAAFSSSHGKAWLALFETRANKAAALVWQVPFQTLKHNPALLHPWRKNRESETSLCRNIFARASAMQVPWSSHEQIQSGAATSIVSLIWHPCGSALAVMDGFGSISFCDMRGNLMHITVPTSISLSPLVTLSHRFLQACIPAPAYHERRMSGARYPVRCGHELQPRQLYMLWMGVMMALQIQHYGDV